MQVAAGEASQAGSGEKRGTAVPELQSAALAGQGGRCTSHYVSGILRRLLPPLSAPRLIFIEGKFTLQRGPNAVQLPRGGAPREVRSQAAARGGRRRRSTRSTRCPVRCPTRSSACVRRSACSCRGRVSDAERACPRCPPALRGPGRHQQDDRAIPWIRRGVCAGRCAACALSLPAGAAGAPGRELGHADRPCGFRCSRGSCSPSAPAGRRAGAAPPPAQRSSSPSRARRSTGGGSPCRRSASSRATGASWQCRGLAGSAEPGHTVLHPLSLQAGAARLPPLCDAAWRVVLRSLGRGAVRRGACWGGRQAAAQPAAERRRPHARRTRNPPHEALGDAGEGRHLP